MDGVGTLRELHIGEGGPLRRFESAVRLTKLSSQIVLELAFTWLPLLLLGLWSELRAERPDPILRDVAVHVRLLVAAPTFLVLDQIFPWVCRLVIGQLIAESFVPPAYQRRLERLLRRARHFTDSALPELIIGLGVLTVAILGLVGGLSIGGMRRGVSPTPAQAWYVVVGWPFFQFLLWRSLWRWAVWSGILFGLSRIDLAVIPTHPDRRAGLSFLALPSVSYCSLFLFAASSVLCADLGTRLHFETLRSFEPLLLSLVILSSLVAFGPLLLFTPRLVRAKIAGLSEASLISIDHARRLRMPPLAAPDGVARAASDAESLFFVGQIFQETVERVRPVLVSTQHLVLLLVATLLPLLVVMVLHIPFEDWRSLIMSVSGGRLH
jgi:hypothetical protein